MPSGMVPAHDSFKKNKEGKQSNEVDLSNTPSMIPASCYSGFPIRDERGREPDRMHTSLRLSTTPLRATDSFEVYGGNAPISHVSCEAVGIDAEKMSLPNDQTLRIHHLSIYLSLFA